MTNFKHRLGHAWRRIVDDPDVRNAAVALVTAIATVVVTIVRRRP